MTIIKEGKGLEVPEEHLITQCPECDCVFTFSPKEAREMPNNGGGRVYFAKCPWCKGNGACFDTGYPGSTEKDRELDARVKAEHKRLWAMVGNDKEGNDRLRAQNNKLSAMACDAAK